ncbi:PLP-dependent aminotransferase family protein [Streptomyces sp. ISL-100]|uniref:aminotransferase-like domain-containing protein n=1 Tax=Streptomyces sp. ISL-100 TaxID=2819173 RepID=UPI002035160E|nr:PLP-dependent aminotransferase family protein [Streptomyces sp. ISL-100]
MALSGTNSAAAQGPDRSPAWEFLLPAASAPARQRGRTLQSALREAVRSGRLAAGTRMPSSRELAADLGVSRGLVTEAYEQLTAEGYLRTGRGAGTWVGGAARSAAREARDLARRAPGVRVDFRPGTPDLSLFPRTAWASTHRSVLGNLPHHALGYPDPRGLPELRSALAGLLTRRRGAVADPERLLVCSGVAQAMTLLGFVLREREQGRGQASVGVEDPGSPEHTALFASAGVSAVPLPLDAGGLATGPLHDSGVRAVVTTPAHQFPLGIGYSAERRAELLGWARAVDGLVVEDDYDGDFRYDRAPVDPTPWQLDMCAGQRSEKPRPCATGAAHRRGRCGTQRFRSLYSSSTRSAGMRRGRKPGQLVSFGSAQVCQHDRQQITRSCSGSGTASLPQCGH